MTSQFFESFQIMVLNGANRSNGINDNCSTKLQKSKSLLQVPFHYCRFMYDPHEDDT